MFADFVHIARLNLHLYEEMQKRKLKFSKTDLQLIKELQEMMKILRKSYAKQDASILDSVHEKGNRITYKIPEKFISGNKNTIVPYFLLKIARAIYVANNPLTGVIHLNTFEKIAKN